MATIKLLSTPQHADGSHEIGAPGGYEFWHFYAEDPAQRLRIAASFHDGFGLHPLYISQYAAYRRRPTRNAPPTPSQFPCLKLGIFENEKKLASSTIFPGPGAFHAEADSISIDDNRAVFGSDGISLQITLRELAASINLNFSPILSPAPERSFPDVDHRWYPARPLCNVTGQVSKAGRNITFSGLGQHNHYFGTKPFLWRTRHWIRGCVLFPLAAEIFQATDDKAIVVSADEGGSRAADDLQFDAVWKKPFLQRRAYPEKMNLGQRLVLRNPRTVLAIERQMQLVYDAYVDGEQASAWVEIDDQ